MNYIEAMEKRHTVRKFLDNPLDSGMAKTLKKHIEKLNRKHNLNMKLICNNEEGIATVWKLICKNANNYVILAGKNSENLDEKIGYASADLMLFAQTLNLNTWWIGGMVNKKVSKLSNNNKILGILVVGYGENQGKAHKSKQMDQVYNYEGKVPLWFINGVKAALMAPTAINRQAFMLTGKNNIVSIEYKHGAFSDVDKGIVKYFFELGAGLENFKWANN